MVPPNHYTFKDNKGFTLIEVIMVLTVIGVLSCIAIPIFRDYHMRAYVVETASNIRLFTTAFRTIALENGTVPDDSHIILPSDSGVEQLISASHWLAPIPLGGNDNREGPDNYPYAGIAILGAPASDSVISKLHAHLDDGNLVTGKFLKTPNGRHTYIID